MIIIDKSNNYYYNKDSFGNSLTSNNPQLLREAFVSLNIPSKALYSSKLKGRLINSPFHNVLSFLDIIHGNGMPGYLIVIVLFIAILKGPSVYRRYKVRKHYRAKRNAVGILGNMEKKIKIKRLSSYKNKRMLISYDAIITILYFTYQYLQSSNKRRSYFVT